MRAEVEDFKARVFNRLQGRDVEKMVEALMEKAEDVCIDDVGMPSGWEVDNEDHQMMFFDLVWEQLRLAYFTPKDGPAPVVGEDI